MNVIRHEAAGRITLSSAAPINGGNMAAASSQNPPPCSALGCLLWPGADIVRERIVNWSGRSILLGHWCYRRNIAIVEGGPTRQLGAGRAGDGGAAGRQSATAALPLSGRLPAGPTPDGGSWPRRDTGATQRIYIAETSACLTGISRDMGATRA
jgi:hypothetical protein